MAHRVPDPAPRPGRPRAAPDQARAREAGFDHHIVKSADIDTLRRLIASVPRRRDASLPNGASITRS